MSGVIYLLTAIVLDVFFLYYAIRMYLVPDDLELPMKMFRFSISYLGFLFAALLIDHYLLFQLSV
jgi:protoheme IX farnesyltransferase